MSENGKVQKRITKDINYKERILGILERQYNRAENNMSLYFNNLEILEQIAKLMTIPRFASMEEYKEALANGLIRQDEKYLIGELSQEEMKYLDSFWKAQIQSANNPKETFRLQAAPTGHSFKEDLKAHISRQEQLNAIEEAKQPSPQLEQEDRTQ